MAARPPAEWGADSGTIGDDQLGGGMDWTQQGEEEQEKGLNTDWGNVEGLPWHTRRREEEGEEGEEPTESPESQLGRRLSALRERRPKSCPCSPRSKVVPLPGCAQMPQRRCCTTHARHRAGLDARGSGMLLATRRASPTTPLAQVVGRVGLVRCSPSHLLQSPPSCLSTASSPCRRTVLPAVPGPSGFLLGPS